MAVGSLLAVFGFLTGRSRSVSTSDELFLLGLSLHFVFFALLSTGFENYAAFNYLFYFAHNDGLYLMMEQTHAGKGHGDIVFVGCHDDMVVAYRSSGLCNKPHAAFMCPLHIVAKGEEGITGQ